MNLAPNQTRSIRPLLRDEYEEGFQKLCAAVEIRPVVEPPDLAAVNGEQIVWARAGIGTIRTEVVGADGTVRQAEGSIPLLCGEIPPPLPVPEPVLRPLTFVKTVLVDAE